MANKIKGEVGLEHEGKRYTMALDFNALADFEEEAGVDNAILAVQDPGRLGASKLRALFWAGLRQRHADMTLELAGQILSANLNKLGEAIATAFPDPEPGAEADPGNAPAARKGRR